MDPVVEFRSHADECRRMARSMRDRNSKATWNNLAERWQHCAEVAESTVAKAAARNVRTRKMKQWSGRDARCE
jgi:hypothetical protein